MPNFQQAYQYFINHEKCKFKDISFEHFSYWFGIYVRMHQMKNSQSFTFTF